MSSNLNIKNLKVGAKSYSIHVGRDDVLDSNLDAHGYIDYVQRRIALRGGCHGTFLVEDFVHEMLHALCDDAAIQEVLNVDDAYVERLVSALAPRLTQLLVDNPMLQFNMLEAIE